MEARSFISSAIVNIDDLVKYDLCEPFLSFFFSVFIDLLIQIMSEHVMILKRILDMIAYSCNPTQRTILNTRHIPPHVEVVLKWPETAGRSISFVIYLLSFGKPTAKFFNSEGERTLVTVNLLGRQWAQRKSPI